MSRELTNECSSCVMTKTVSMSGAKVRFVSAIWYSYSKSEMVRMPRRITRIFFRRAYSTSRPSKLSTSRFFIPFPTPFSRSTRSDFENVGCFAGPSDTAIVRRSKIRRPRLRTSMWPFVTGSKEPG